jgi:hypothetical protein
MRVSIIAAYGGVSSGFLLKVVGLTLRTITAACCSIYELGLQEQRLQILVNGRHYRSQVPALFGLALSFTTALMFFEPHYRLGAAASHLQQHCMFPLPLIMAYHGL